MAWELMMCVMCELQFVASGCYAIVCDAGIVGGHAKLISCTQDKDLPFLHARLVVILVAVLGAVLLLRKPFGRA